MFNPWLSLTFEAIRLGLDAQSVIACRMMRLSAGGAHSQTEARRMISEKFAAGLEVQAATVSGMIAGDKDTVVARRIIRRIQKRVGANKRRLSRR